MAAQLSSNLIERIRKRTLEILEIGAPEDQLSRTFDLFILSLIALNVLALMLQSVAAIRNCCPWLFRWFEVVSVMIFTAEYVLRIWSCTAAPRYASPVSGRLRFARTPFALIDLFAILPFYLPFLGVDLRFIRAMRLFRLLRLGKLGRYSRALRVIGAVLRAKKEELLSTLFFLLLLLILASSTMYFAEKDAQPEKFSSIPAAMWWGVATLTTVGYGDVCPVTSLGRVLGGVITILGIGFFALPTAVLGAGFVEEMQRRRKEPQKCPHCGRDISSPTEDRQQREEPT